MQSDGYTLDDKRNKQEGYGDLQDIVAQFHSRQHEQTTEKPSPEGEGWVRGNNNTERTGKYFSVPRQEIVDENYDLSLSRYKEDVFEEIHYEKPDVILQKLLVSEVGEDLDFAVLGNIQGGIVKELLALKGMIG